MTRNRLSLFLCGYWMSHLNLKRSTQSTIKGVIISALMAGSLDSLTMTRESVAFQTPQTNKAQTPVAC